MFGELLGGRPPTGLYFSGTLSRFDLTAAEFVRCRFDGATWANCDFGPATRFTDCVFHGGGMTYCRGFGDARLLRPQHDIEAQMWIRGQQIVAGRHRYAADDLRADMTAVVKKFIGRSGLTTKSVVERNLFAGPVGASRHRNEIVDVFKRLVIVRHVISGASDDGYAVRPEAEEAVRFFAANNVFTGRLDEAYRSLVVECGIAPAG